MGFDTTPSHSESGLKDDNDEHVFCDAVAVEALAFGQAASHTLASLQELLLELLSLEGFVAHLWKLVHEKFGILLRLLQKVDRIVKKLSSLTRRHNSFGLRKLFLWGAFFHWLYRVEGKPVDFSSSFSSEVGGTQGLPGDLVN